MKKATLSLAIAISVLPLLLPVHAQIAPNDGIPLSWRQTYFATNDFNTLKASAIGDPDGDGANNYLEYLSQTDPVNAGSHPGGPVALETFAGSAQAGDTNGFRTAARFNNITSLLADKSGTLWLTEYDGAGFDIPGAGPSRIRRIFPDGTVSIFAGSSFGTEDGPLATARFDGPTAIAIDSKTNIFVVDRYSHRIRKIQAGGIVTTFAGWNRGFQDGQGTNAMFNLPMGIVIDEQDNLYVADWFNTRIRKITPSGLVSTWAGGSQGFLNGPRLSAQFGGATDLTRDSRGNIYVADWANGAIRLIETNGNVSTFASGIQYVEQVSADSDGNIYAEIGGTTLTKYATNGAVIWSISPGAGNVDGPLGGGARLDRAGKVITLHDGNLLTPQGPSIRKIILSNPTLLTIAPASGLYSSNILITMTNQGSGRIFYTRDGADPTTNSFQYTGSFLLTNAATIKARLFINSFPVSAIVTQAYTFGPLPFAFLLPRSYLLMPGSGLSIEAGGGGSGISLQWMLNGGDVAGATNNVISLNNIQPSQAGEYRLRASNGLGSSISDPVIIRIEGQPACLPGLIAAWPGESALEAVQNKSCILTGGVTFAAGVRSNAFSFDGTGEVSQPSEPRFNLKNFTMEGWIMPTLLDGETEVIITKELAPQLSSIAFEIGIRGPLSASPNRGIIPVGNLDFYLGGLVNMPDDYFGWVDGKVAVPLSRWSHVALTFDGSTVKVYLNARLTRAITNVSGSILTNSAPVRVGSRSSFALQSFPGDRFNGRIDEFGIYDRALPAADIAQIYDAAASGRCIGAPENSIDVTVSTIAGSTVPGYRDGSGADALFNSPNDLSIGLDGSIYVADAYNQRIRVITQAAQVSTFAGNGLIGSLDSFTATDASFAYPLGVFASTNSDIFVADTENNRIRKINQFGSRQVSTVAGAGLPGNVNTNSSNARFNFPNDIVQDSAGNLYVSEFNNHTIRKISPSGAVTSFAGSGAAGYADGFGTNAFLNRPAGLAIDKAGTLYLSEWGNQRIRKITPDGRVTTLAGNGQAGFNNGPSTNATFNNPDDLAIDTEGNIYLVEGGNHAVRKITPSGIVSTVAGTGVSGYVDGPGQMAQFSRPAGIAIDAQGNLFVADTGNNLIRKLTFGTSTNPPITTNYFAQRSLQKYYTPGTNLPVFIAAKPLEGASVYAVEDSLPPGWTAFNIGSGGTYDAANQKVKFGPFFDSTPRTLVYVVQVPAGETGTKVFTGLVSVDGKSNPIGGTNTIDLAPLLHPADNAPANNRISIDELTAYGLSWRKGLSWPISPSPIPIDYVTRAGTLWRGGETYTLNPAIGSAPLWWVNTSNGVFTASAHITIAAASSAVALQPASAVLGEPNIIKILVSPSSSVSAFAVQDSIPPGYTVQNISNSGEFDGAARVIRWGPFLDNQARELTYSATATVDSPQEATFTGVASFDGLSVPIEGQRTISVLNWPIIPRGADVSRPYAFTNFAGATGQSGTNDGPIATARLSEVISIAVHTDGTIYFVDRVGGTSPNLRKITSSGVVQTLITRLGPSYGGGPNGPKIALDPSGYIYVSSPDGTIQKVAPDGTRIVLAGAAGQFGSTDGAGSSARFRYPDGITVDSSGTIYVADSGNFTVRKLTPNGVVTTIAGSAGEGGYVDGPGAVARFGKPNHFGIPMPGIGTDSAGNIYVTDGGNFTVRKISIDGRVASLAGGQPGYLDAVGTEARLGDVFCGEACNYEPAAGGAVDESGYVFLTDYAHNAIRRISPDGKVVTIGGPSSGTGEGVGIRAQFNWPMAVAVDRQGTLYIGDTQNYRILRATPAFVELGPTRAELRLAGTNVAISVMAPPGRTVRVERSDDLHNWSTVTDVKLLGTRTNLTSPAGAKGRQFFRARTQE